MPPRHKQHKFFRQSFSFQPPSLRLLPALRTTQNVNSPVSAVSPSHRSGGARGYFVPQRTGDVDVEKQQAMVPVVEEAAESSRSSRSSSGDEDDEDWVAAREGENGTETEERVRIDKGLFGWLGTYVLSSIGTALLVPSLSHPTPHLHTSLTLLLALFLLIPFLRTNLPLTRAHVLLPLSFTALLLIPLLSTSLLPFPLPLPTINSANRPLHQSISHLHTTLLPITLYLISPSYTPFPRPAFLSLLTSTSGTILLFLFSSYTHTKTTTTATTATLLALTAATFTLFPAYHFLDLVSLSRRPFPPSSSSTTSPRTPSIATTPTNTTTSASAAASVWSRQLLLPTLLLPCLALYHGEFHTLYESMDSVSNLLGRNFLTEITVKPPFNPLLPFPTPLCPR
ncbi:MAG: hypothetical protein Q9227_005929 [Pyrenula ochraceoflavens]